jgi:hypothetical protein
MRSPCCLCLYVCPPMNFWMMKLGMYILAAEHISLLYFINPSHQYIPTFLMLLGNGSVNIVPLGRNTCNNRKIVGHIIFFVIPVISKESLWVCPCILISLLVNGSVNTFPWRWIIIGFVIFYAIYVISKESRLLDLLRTSCFFILCVNFYILVRVLFLYSCSYCRLWRGQENNTSVSNSSV